jgi:hypothetical protein
VTFTPWRTASELFSAGGLECLAASVSYVYMDSYLARRGVGAITAELLNPGPVADPPGP